MNIRKVFVLLSSSAILLAQTPSGIAPKTLIQEPLGATSEPKMSLFILNLPGGLTAPSHSHAGAVFAYLLQGDIENQVEPDPPQIFHPGGFFHERPMQVHRLLRNLSTTEPAKLLIFQNTGSLPAATKPLLQEPLTNIANQQVSVISLVVAPDAEGSGPHQHPGSVFAYVVKGEIESQVDPDPPKTYRSGDVFYEPPMHAHRLFRNLSKTEPAELLVFQVSEKGQPLAMPVAAQTQTATPPAQARPNMMPYVSILDPQFIPASQASFLQDDDIVIAVARGKVAKAFPAADLAQHGSVNDLMPDGPIEVTWCGVCNTGAVFHAQFQGRLLHFDYDSMVNANEVHKDRETGSRWQQSSGEAISGPLKGSFLELYPFVRTTWKEWRRRYPNTQVLKPLPGYDERMPGLNKIQKANRLSNDGDAPKAAFGRDDRLRPKETVAGLRIGAEEKAFPFSQLRIARVVNDRVGGVPILVVHQPSSDTTTAFDARAKGKVLQFQAEDADASSLIDLETHSSWSAYGLCLKGPLKGTQLKALILMPEFWFAWSEFHPKTGVFTASITQLHAQAPVWETLLQKPLPESAEPTISAFSISGPPAPPVQRPIGEGHTHAGPVFVYILQGEIETQVEPDPPAIYHPGQFFYEAPMHVHRFQRNLSKTESSRVIVFQAGTTGQANPAVKLLRQEALQTTANQQLRLLRLTLPAGAHSEARAHTGPGFVYVLEGSIATSSATYAAGDLFLEPANRPALTYKNASADQPAKLLLYQVSDQ